MFGASCLYIKTFSQLGWQINFFDESNLFWNNQKMTQRFSNKNFSMASGKGGRPVWPLQHLSMHFLIIFI